MKNVSVATLTAGLVLGGIAMFAADRYLYGSDIAAVPPPSTPALPDWSGGWGDLAWQTGEISGAKSLMSQSPPLKPEGLAKLAEIQRLAAAGGDATFRGANAQCRPPMFVGNMGGPETYIEFLMSPTRVTILTEGGLIRRIYTDGRALPAEPDVTNAGISVGHWEGGTLVVETTGINPKASIGFVAEAGQNAHVSERLFLKEKDILEVDTTIVAPDALTGPYTTTTLFKRDPAYEMHEYTICVDYDRSIDPATGRQRFDTTVPSDLPPPPTP